MPVLKHRRSSIDPRLWLLCACSAWYLLSGAPIALSQDTAKKAAAQTPADSAKKTTTTASKSPATAGDSAQRWTADQLDALVAPIALYPDELLGQTLVASTYPLEIVQLHQWLAKHPKLKDKELADSVGKQPWDPSIQTMAAIPDLVKRLADDIQWTTELGNAFLAQQTEVMDAVQRMRKKAKDKGALETNEQQKVETKVVEQKQVIVVESANPEVIYVPSYSPTVVYGPPVYAYPPIYYPPYTPGMAFVSFGVGMMWGAAMWGGSCCYARWGGGYGNVNINVNNNFNRVNHYSGGRGGSWSHNPQHRGGAPYADQRTANKYGGSTRGQGQGQRGTGGAGVSDRAAGGQGQRGAGGAGVSDRSAAGAQGQRSAGVSDRSASGGTGRSASGGDFSGGGNRGSASTPRSSGSSYGGGGGFGGGSGGYSGSQARASSSRGASSMGSRGGYGGGSRGGGGRRR